MTIVLAHGIGGLRDLPVPTWLFYYGAALVLLLSFIALWALWTKPHLEQLSRGRPLPDSLARVFLSSTMRIALGTIGFGLFLLVAAAALVGEPSPTQNIAPTFVYVLFWLGVVVLVVLFGNVWAWLSPWRAAADAVAWTAERLGVSWEPPLDYPERLGRWPAAVLLLAFAALELAYIEPADPRMLALAIYLYSGITWLGMLAFGRRAWLENGDAFAVYFGLLSRLSPFAVREVEGRQHILVRPPLLSVSLRGAGPGTLAFVAVMLGTVAFDGFSRTSWWIDRRYDVIIALGDSPTLADAVATLLNVAGLLAMVRRRRGRLHAGGPDRRAALLAGEAVDAVPGEPRPHRPRLPGRALLLSPLLPGAGGDPARLGPLRLGLGPVRNRRLPAELRRAERERHLVRAGCRARRGARRGPRPRPRSGREPRRLAQARRRDAVPDAGADGALHRRRALAAVGGLVLLQVMLPSFWVASTKPESPLARSQG